MSNTGLNTLNLSISCISYFLNIINLEGSNIKNFVCIFIDKYLNYEYLIDFFKIRTKRFQNN